MSTDLLLSDESDTARLFKPVGSKAAADVLLRQEVGQLPKDFVQDTAFALHNKLRELHRTVTSWEDAARKGKPFDAASVVIAARDTAKELYALAGVIEQRMGP